MNTKKYLAEAVGTMVLVLMGCGTAVFNAGVHNSAWVLPVAFGFGLSVVAMAYTIGGISGCHINPAITFGVWLSGRMSGKDAINYIIFQVIGAVVGSAIIYILVHTGFRDAVAGVGDFSTSTGANGWGGNITMVMALIAEIVFTCVFVLVVLGTTDSKVGAGNFAGLAIGLSLVLVHIACIPITGTSVNPARSTGPAIFELIQGNSGAISQLWLFWVAPLIGAALSAGIWKCLSNAYHK